MSQRTLRHRVLTAVAVLLSVTIAFQLPAAAQEEPPVAAEAQIPAPPPIEFWWWLDDLHEFLIGLGGQPAVEATIRDAAAEFGVSAELMLCLARYESGLNPAAKNPRSSATGLFQHLAGSDGKGGYYRARALAVGYPEHQVDAYRPRQNARAAAWLLKTGGVRHWVVAGRCR